jgi:aspartate/glutamate racemase
VDTDGCMLQDFYSEMIIESKHTCINFGCIYGLTGGFGLGVHRGVLVGTDGCMLQDFYSEMIIESKHTCINFGCIMD